MKAARRLFSVFAVLTMLATGCAREKEVSLQEARSKDAALVAASGPFAKFNLDAIHQNWQGAWVVGGTVLGRREAWEVKGDQATVFDGEKEEKFGFKLVAPCSARLSQTVSGTTTGTYFNFAFSKDKLYAGLGQAGVRKQDAIVACISGSVYTLEGGNCLKWEKSLFDDTLKSSAAECSLKDEGERKIFEVMSHGRPSRLQLQGEVLLDQQMEGNVALKAADLAEAKAKLGAK